MRVTTNGFSRSEYEEFQLITYERYSFVPDQRRSKTVYSYKLVDSKSVCSRKFDVVKELVKVATADVDVPFRVLFYYFRFGIYYCEFTLSQRREHALFPNILQLPRIG